MTGKLEVKRIRVTDAGDKLIVRIGFQTNDTLVQSHGWLEAKIELGLEWRHKTVADIRQEALLLLRNAISQEMK